MDEHYFGGIENTPFGKIVIYMEGKIEECLGDLSRLCKFERLADFLKEKQTDTVMGLACVTGSVKLMNSLIEQGADLNAVAAHGLPPLLVLCQNTLLSPTNDDIAKLLLNAKADINLRNSEGQTALHMACMHNKLSMVKILIKAGADVNTVDVHGNTPVMECCKRASLMLTAWLQGRVNADYTRRGPAVRICVRLVKAGADPKQGTVLPYVMVFTKIAYLEKVIKLGFDVNMPDDMRRTALDFTPVAFDGPHKVMKLLIAHGLKFNPRDNELKTDLMAEAYNQGDLDMLCYFLSFGYDLKVYEMQKVKCPNLSEWARSGKEAIDMDDKLLAWNLVIKAGFPIGLREVTETIGVVVKASGRSEVSSTMKDVLFPFFTLGDLCRLIIRSRLRPPVNCSIDRLALPSTVKSFLKFEDFIVQARSIKLGKLSVS